MIDYFKRYLRISLYIWGFFLSVIALAAIFLLANFYGGPLLVGVVVLLLVPAVFAAVPFEKDVM